jgi:hypothetical protein
MWTIILKRVFPLIGIRKWVGLYVVDIFNII